MQSGSSSSAFGKCIPNRLTAPIARNWLPLRCREAGIPIRSQSFDSTTSSGSMENANLPPVHDAVVTPAPPKQDVWAKLAEKLKSNQAAKKDAAKNLEVDSGSRPVATPASSKHELPEYVLQALEKVSTPPEPFSTNQQDCADSQRKYSKMEVQRSKSLPRNSTPKPRQPNERKTNGPRRVMSQTLKWRHSWTMRLLAKKRRSTRVVCFGWPWPSLRRRRNVEGSHTKKRCESGRAVGSGNLSLTLCPKLNRRSGGLCQSRGSTDHEVVSAWGLSAV